jgi:phage-related tail protein
MDSSDDDDNIHAQYVKKLKYNHPSTTKKMPSSRNSGWSLDKLLKEKEKHEKQKKALLELDQSLKENSNTTADRSKAMNTFLEQHGLNHVFLLKLKQ